MTYEGIDLSRHNVVTDWNKVKKDFVILRAGGNYGGFYKDSKFESYYEACKSRGIPVGAYYDAGKELCYADGKEYAQHFMKLIKGKTFEMPVYIDIEVVPASMRKANTGAAIAFCEELEKYNILIIEDIVDSGRTLARLTTLLKNRNASSVKTCTLLDKPSRREVDFTPDFCGATIPDEFVVGFGLDYDEKYRNLPFVGVLKREVYEK